MARLHEPSVRDSHTLSVSFIWSLIILVFFGLVLLGFYYSTSTGYAGLQLTSEDLVAGELVSGTLSYNFADGPLPRDTDVVLSVNGYQKILPLEDLYNAPTQTIVFSPLLKVVVRLEEVFTGETSSTSSEGTSTGPTKGSKGAGSSIGRPSVAAPSSPMVTAPLVEYRTYYVRADELTSDSIPSNRNAFIEEVRLVGTNELLENSVVSLDTEGTRLELATSYHEDVVGFTQTSGEVVIPLDAFDFMLSARTGSPASISVTFDYQGNTFASIEKAVSVRTLAQIVDEELPQDTPSSIVSGSGSSLGSSGQGSIDSIDEEVCESPVCTSFGACSIPPLSGTGTYTLGTSYVRTRQCICQNGQTFNEQESCTLTNEDTISVASGEVDSFEPLDELPTPPIPASITRSSEGSSSSTSWERTYTFEERELVVAGSVAQTLGENERIKLPFGNTQHSIGVLTVDSSGSVPRVLLEIASTPQEFYLNLGETRALDMDDDEIFDVAVSFVSLSARNKVLIRVAPLENSLFSQMVGVNDRTATLLSTSRDAPVAYVILNDELPSLRVFFVQSRASLPTTCFNSLVDANEEGLDCGGLCNACKVERGFYLPLLSWIGVIVLFCALAFMSRSH